MDIGQVDFDSVYARSGDGVLDRDARVRICGGIENYIVVIADCLMYLCYQFAFVIGLVKYYFNFVLFGVLANHILYV